MEIEQPVIVSKEWMDEALATLDDATEVCKVEVKEA